jgi:hypothetical protein
MTEACRDDDLVNRFIEGHAPAEERSAILAHMGVCEDCRPPLVRADQGDLPTTPPTATEVGDRLLLRGTEVGRFRG